MTIKSHLTSSFLLTNAVSFIWYNELIPKKLSVVNYYLHKVIPNTHFLLFVLLGIFIGVTFPDLDQLIKNGKHYTTYHRQVTHSFLWMVLAVVLWTGYACLHFHFKYSYIIVGGVLGIVTGIALHILEDIFFGKGGVPVMLKTKNWQSKGRISVPIFKNEGLVSFFIQSFGVISVFSLFYLVNKHNVLWIKILLVGEFILLTSLKNSKTAVLWSSIFFLVTAGYYIFFL